VGVVLAALGLEAALIVSHVGDGAAFDDITWGWLLAAVATEVVSVASLGALYRPLLRAGGVSVRRGRGVALGAAASAITATVPAGTAVASGYLFGQFRRAGSNPAAAGWAVLVAAALSVAGFGAVVAAGAAFGADDWVDTAWQVGGVGVAAALIVVGTSTLLTRRPGALVAVLGPVYRRLPGNPDRRAARETKLDSAAAQLASIRPAPGHWLRAFGFAALTWASDLATFLLSLHAVGVHHLGIGAATLAYGAGLATTSISLVPAGIGAVEAGMLLGLTSAGVAGPVALAGIVTYRVVAYVLVAAAGWAIWAALRRADGRLVRSPASPARITHYPDGLTESLAA
jgi:hypothetical protein